MKINGAHPREVATDFGVHLRTVFRWIKRGWLAAEHGRITTDYQTATLPDWKRTCTFRETGQKLKVSNGTLTAWKNRGLLQLVTVMGFERVPLSCIESISRRRRIGTFSLHPTHSLPNLLLQITGIGHHELKKVLDDGTVPATLIDGTLMIPNEAVEAIRSEWNASCYNIAAQRILGKTKGTISRRVKNGKLSSIIVLGRRRVVLKGLAKTPEELERLRAYLRFEKKKYLGRKTAALKAYRKKRKLKAAKNRQRLKEQQSRERFRAKRMDLPYRPPRSVPAIIPDYTPVPVSVKGFESRRLTTCEEAGKATGKTAAQIQALFGSGSVRGEMVDDRIYVYITSVNALVTKLKQGALR